MGVRKVNESQVRRKKAPSRLIRELVSHRKLESKGIALRLVELLPTRMSGPRHPHSHRGMEEVIYVQSGRGKAWVEGEITTIKPGDTILIPAGVRHMMVNTGRKHLTLLCSFSAADPENRFREYPGISYAG